MSNKQAISLERTENGLIKVITPYNSVFVGRCRNLRGNFAEGAWFFDDSVEEYVRDAMKTIFGVDGVDPVEYCTLLVKDFTDRGYKGPVELFGRTIAKAYGRDSYAKLGDEIVFISGSYSAGGSVKNWLTQVTDATFEIRNFPLERTKFPDIQEAIEDGWVEIKKDAKSQEQIRAEIKAYQDKIAELEAQL